MGSFLGLVSSFPKRVNFSRLFFLIVKIINEFAD